METKGITISPVNIEQRKGWDMRAGDMVKVTQKIKEGEAKDAKKAKKGEKVEAKYRFQVFEGLVLARKHGGTAGGTFTVRRVSSGVGVEKIFPLYSPNVESVEIIKRAKTRRAKLYHIRDKAAKEINREMRHIREARDEEPEVVVAPKAEVETAK